MPHKDDIHINDDLRKVAVDLRGIGLPGIAEIVDNAREYILDLERAIRKLKSGPEKELIAPAVGQSALTQRPANITSTMPDTPAARVMSLPFTGKLHIPPGCEAFHDLHHNVTFLMERGRGLVGWVRAQEVYGMSHWWAMDICPYARRDPETDTYKVIP